MKSSTKISLFILACASILAIIFLSIPIRAPTNWTIDGNKVYVDDANVYLSAEPHTIYQSGYVYFNLTSKQYSGDIDVLWGFDTSITKPIIVDFYKPHNVNITKSYTCSGTNLWYNYTTNPKHFWCWYNNSYIDNSTGETKYEDILVFEHDFESYNLSINTVYWNETIHKDWIDVTNKFDKINYEYGGMTKWYYIKNFTVTANKNYQVRAFIKVPVSSNLGGKYWFVVKPSSESIQEAINNGHFYFLDPWWNSSWVYRVPIHITVGDGSSLTDYEIPISINTSKLYNEGKIRSDCGDIRFLNNASSDATELSYFIMNNDGNRTCNISGNTTIWVKTNINSTIWMYYGNPSATSSSNASATFSYYEGFENLNLGSLNGQDSWSGNTEWNVTNDYAYYGSQSVKIYNVWEKTIERPIPYNYTKVRFFVAVRASDNADDPAMYPCITDSAYTPTNAYCWQTAFSTFRYGYAGNWRVTDVSTVQEANKWYWLEMIADYDNNKFKKLYVNGSLVSENEVGYSNGDSFDKVGLKVGGGVSGKTRWVDEIIIAQYHDPEPTYNIGSEENLLINVTIYSPQNITYNTTNISLQFNVSSTYNISTCWYNLNGGSDVEITNCSNTTIIAQEGSNHLVLYANNTLGNVNSDNVFFTVDTIPPQLDFVSPTLPNESITGNNWIFVNVSSNEPLNSCILWWDPPTIERGPNYIEVCNNSICTRTIYSKPINMLDASGTYKPVTEVVSFDWTGGYDGVFNLSWYEGFITLRPYVNFSGSVYTIQQVKTARPEIEFSKARTPEEGGYKYSITLSNINDSDKTKFNGIVFDLVEAHGITWSDVRKEGQSIIIKDKIKLSYKDLLESGFTLSVINKTRVMIGNISENIVNGTLFIDPTITLQDNITENIGDAYVDRAYPNRNYGIRTYLKVQKTTWQRIYIKFNISSIPICANITNATLWLFLDNDQGADTIMANHVLNYSWAEGTLDGSTCTPTCIMEENITWNNQPCYNATDDTTSLNADNCNTTILSNVTTDGTKDDTWQFWTITDAVRQEFDSGHKNVSILLWTVDAAAADIFVSKEDTNSSRWPYLVITYGIKEDNYSMTVVNNTCYLNMTGLEDNDYYFRVYANDTVGNLNWTEPRKITVDSTPPQITINSPQNITYNTNQIFINITQTEAHPEMMWYAFPDEDWDYFGENTNATLHTNNIDPVNLVQLWNITPLASTGDSYGRAIHDGIIYTASGKNLYAIYLNGSIKWNVSNIGTSTVTNGITYYNDMLYLTNEDKRLYAVYAENGTQAWNWSDGQNIRSGIIIYDDIIYISTSYGMYALYLNGTQKWNTTVCCQWEHVYKYFTPVIYNNRIYLGSWSNKIHSLYLDNGTEEWESSDTIDTHPYGNVILHNGTLYAGDESANKLFAYYLNGTKKWEYQATDKVYRITAIDDTIYYSGANGLVGAVYENGTTRWNKTLGTSDFRYILSTDDFIYLLSIWTEQTIYRLYKNGTVETNISFANYQEQQLQLSNGMLFEGKWDILYAFGDGTSNNSLERNISFPEDGTYRLKAISRDSLGAYNETEIVFTIDTTPPDLSFASPTPSNGSHWNKDWVFINITSNEQLSNCTLNWDNANESMTVSADNYSCYINKTGISEGSHQYFVFGYDLVSNINQTEDRTLIVDLTPPNLTWVSPTESNNTLLPENQTYIEWNFSSDEDLNVSIIVINGTNHTCTASTARYCYLNETLTNITNQTRCAYGWGWDLAGNFNQTELRCLNTNIPVKIENISINSYDSLIWVGVNTSAYYNFTFVNYAETEFIDPAYDVSSYISSLWANTSSKHLNVSIPGYGTAYYIVNVTALLVNETAWQITWSRSTNFLRYSYKGFLVTFEENITPNLNVYYNVSISRLTSYSSRDSDLDTVYIDNTVGISKTDYEDNVTFKITKSLDQGLHTVKLLYYKRSGATEAGGGGIITPPTITDYDVKFIIEPSGIEVSVTIIDENNFLVDERTISTEQTLKLTEGIYKFEFNAKGYKPLIFTRAIQQDTELKIVLVPEESEEESKAIEYPESVSVDKSQRPLGQAIESPATNWIIILIIAVIMIYLLLGPKEVNKIIKDKLY